VNKKLLILVVFTVISILIGGMNSTVLIGTQYTATKSGYFVSIAPWWNTSWSYRKLICINHSQVDSDLNNFPILVNITDTDLRDDAQDDGDDISFVICDGFNIQLNHEIEHYDNTTGQLVAWVNITSLSSSRNTSFYMYYGNSICSSNENVPGTYDSNYVAVWHLNETGTGTRYDSSSNNNDGTPQSYDGDEATTGKIDGADYFEDGDVPDGEYINCGNNTSLQITGNLTIEAWVQIEGSDGEYMGIAGKFVTPDGYSLTRHESNVFRFWIANGEVWGNVDSDTTYTDSNWHYVVGVINSETNYLYVDGVQQSDTNTTTLTNDSGEFAFIGRQYSNYNQRCWQGKIDEVRISNTSRSAGWISTSYNTMHNTSTFISVLNEQTQS